MAAQLSLRRAAKPCSSLGARPVAPRRCGAVRVRAAFNSPNKALSNVMGALEDFTKRYDVTSTGLGALTVTGYCVYVHGQDPWTALSITFSATVFALVVNELLLSGNNSSKSL